MPHPTIRRCLVGLSAVTTIAGVVSAVPASAAPHTTDNRYQRVNLVSDQPGMAATTDPNLVNPWGMSRGPDTPIWVSDNGTDVSTLYKGAIPGTPVSTVPLVVGTPGGAPTGQVFNDTQGFVVPGTSAPALFVFAGEDGDLSAWNQSVPTITKAVAVRHVTGAIYKGLALVHSAFGPLLLAANFHDNRVDVFDSTFHRLSVPSLFRDRTIPAGYAPFNVAEVGHRVFVSYAQQDAAGEDDVPGAGHGFIDVFSAYGALQHRFVSRGVLNSPWGMTIAPEGFGAFAGDLLVGNFGNGRIHAFDPLTGHLDGTLLNRQQHAVVIPGLWGLLVGDPSSGGADSVWFSAGPDDEAHGLLGILRAA